MTYSGTISAAMEGTICGIPSIAFSQEVAKDFDGDLYQVARRHGLDVLRDIISIPWDRGVFMNVNFPLHPDLVKGIETTRQGFRDDAELFINEREDPRGKNYYWIGFRRQYGAPKAGTDLSAIKRGYISISPLHLDLTHEESLSTLARSVNTEF